MFCTLLNNIENTNKRNGFRINMYRWSRSVCTDTQDRSEEKMKEIGKVIMRFLDVPHTDCHWILMNKHLVNVFVRFMSFSMTTRREFGKRNSSTNFVSDLDFLSKWVVCKTIKRFVIFSISKVIHSFVIVSACNLYWMEKFYGFIHVFTKKIKSKLWMKTRKG